MSKHGRLVQAWKATGAIVALCGCMMAHAEDWPSRPIKLVVPSTAGSTPDVFARILADALRTGMGATVAIDNKPGAGGAVAVNVVAKASPDGYTVGITPPGPMGADTLLQNRLPYDPAKDLALVTLAVTQANVLVVRSTLNAKDMGQLISTLEKDPEKYTYAAIGAGSINRLCMELVAQQSGTKMTRVPYAGTPQAILAVISGEVDMACLPEQAVAAQVQAGKLRALAIASAKRSTVLADVPTLRELGMPGIEADSWMGIIAPAGTSPAIVKRLRSAIAQALSQPGTREMLRTQFMEVVASTPEAFARTVQDDVTRWKFLIRTRGISLD
ncbi:tripartite tricarboxylate transporter substrate binding protein [Cupriavidus sp. amp6]|uniref:Bug family tripartite tricarboxylate transporter substrate binding protein n=1 Tax=Cupriavidus sp. amp6 TaxID=388051 RepID=UPI000429FF4F|nr:tripartite tricarboxylate transporter substrate binding protein [Cupriavidus sp. amp6]